MPKIFPYKSFRQSFNRTHDFIFWPLSFINKLAAITVITTNLVLTLFPIHLEYCQLGEWQNAEPNNFLRTMCYPTARRMPGWVKVAEIISFTEWYLDPHPKTFRNIFEFSYLIKDITNKIISLTTGILNLWYNHTTALSPDSGYLQPRESRHHKRDPTGSGCLPRGGTWVFRGAHTFVIKIKKYP